MFEMQFILLIFFAIFYSVFAEPPSTKIHWGPHFTGYGMNKGAAPQPKFSSLTHWCSGEGGEVTYPRIWSDNCQNNIQNPQDCLDAFREHFPDYTLTQTMIENALDWYSNTGQPAGCIYKGHTAHYTPVDGWIRFNRGNSDAKCGVDYTGNYEYNCLCDSIIDESFMDFMWKFIDCSGFSSMAMKHIADYNEIFEKQCAAARPPSKYEKNFNDMRRNMLRINSVCRNIEKNPLLMRTIKHHHFLARNTWTIDLALGDIEAHLSTLAFEAGRSYTVSATVGILRVISFGAVDVELTYESTSAMGFVLGWDFKNNKLICGIDMNADHGVELDIEVGTPGGGFAEGGYGYGQNYEYGFFWDRSMVDGGYAFSSGQVQAGVEAGGLGLGIGAGVSAETITYHPFGGASRIGRAAAWGVDYEIGGSSSPMPGASISAGIGVGGGSGTTQLYISKDAGYTSNEIWLSIDGKITNSDKKCADGQIKHLHVNQIAQIKYGEYYCTSCPPGTQFETINKPAIYNGACNPGNKCTQEGQTCYGFEKKESGRCNALIKTAAECRAAAATLNPGDTTTGDTVSRSDWPRGCYVSKSGGLWFNDVVYSNRDCGWDDNTCLCRKSEIGNCCQLGIWINTNCDSTGNKVNICEPCIEGKIKPADAIEDICVDCPAGYFDYDKPGEFEPEPSSNWFAQDVNEGFKIAQSEVCQICPVGWTQPADGRWSCIECETGKYQQTITHCEECPQGRFEDRKGQFIHQDGQYSTEIYDLAPNDDNTCKECPKGWFQSEKGQQSCEECPEGYISAENGSPDCTPCKDVREWPVYKYERNCGLKECNFWRKTFTASTQYNTPPANQRPKNVVIKEAESHVTFIKYHPSPWNEIYGNDCPDFVTQNDETQSILRMIIETERECEHATRANVNRVWSESVFYKDRPFGCIQNGDKIMFNRGGRDIPCSYTGDWECICDNSNRPDNSNTPRTKFERDTSSSGINFMIQYQDQQGQSECKYCPVGQIHNDYTSCKHITDENTALIPASTDLPAKYRYTGVGTYRDDAHGLLKRCPANKKVNIERTTCQGKFTASNHPGGQHQQKSEGDPLYSYNNFSIGSYELPCVKCPSGQFMPDLTSLGGCVTGYTNEKNILLGNPIKEYSGPAYFLTSSSEPIVEMKVISHGNKIIKFDNEGTNAMANFIEYDNPNDEHITNIDTEDDLQFVKVSNNEWIVAGRTNPDKPDIWDKIRIETNKDIELQQRKQCASEFKGGKCYQDSIDPQMYPLNCNRCQYPDRTLNLEWVGVEDRENIPSDVTDECVYDTKCYKELQELFSKKWKKLEDIIYQAKFQYSELQIAAAARKQEEYMNYWKTRCFVCNWNADKYLADYNQCHNLPAENCGQCADGLDKTKQDCQHSAGNWDEVCNDGSTRDQYQCELDRGYIRYGCKIYDLLQKDIISSREIHNEWAEPPWIGDPDDTFKIYATATDQYNEKVSELMFINWRIPKLKWRGELEQESLRISKRRYDINNCGLRNCECPLKVNEREVGDHRNGPFADYCDTFDHVFGVCKIKHGQICTSYVHEVGYVDDGRTIGDDPAPPGRDEDECNLRKSTWGMCSYGGPDMTKTECESDGKREDWITSNAGLERQLEYRPEISAQTVYKQYSIKNGDKITKTYYPRIPHDYFRADGLTQTKRYPLIHKECFDTSKVYPTRRLAIFDIDGDGDKDIFATHKRRPYKVSGKSVYTDHSDKLIFHKNYKHEYGMESDQYYIWGDGREDDDTIVYDPNKGQEARSGCRPKTPNYKMRNPANDLDDNFSKDIVPVFQTLTGDSLDTKLYVLDKADIKSFEWNTISRPSFNSILNIQAGDKFSKYEVIDKCFRVRWKNAKYMRFHSHTSVWMGETNFGSNFQPRMFFHSAGTARGFCENLEDNDSYVTLTRDEAGLITGGKSYKTAAKKVEYDCSQHSGDVSHQMDCEYAGRSHSSDSSKWSRCRWSFKIYEWGRSYDEGYLTQNRGYYPSYDLKGYTPDTYDANGMRVPPIARFKYGTCESIATACTQECQEFEFFKKVPYVKTRDFTNTNHVMEYVDTDTIPIDFRAEYPIKYELEHVDEGGTNELFYVGPLRNKIVLGNPWQAGESMFTYYHYIHDFDGDGDKDILIGGDVMEYYQNSPIETCTDKFVTDQDECKTVDDAEDFDYQCSFFSFGRNCDPFNDKCNECTRDRKFQIQYKCVDENGLSCGDLDTSTEYKDNDPYKTYEAYDRNCDFHYTYLGEAACNAASFGSINCKWTNYGVSPKYGRAKKNGPGGEGWCSATGQQNINILSSEMHTILGKYDIVPGSTRGTYGCHYKGTDNNLHPVPGMEQVKTYSWEWRGDTTNAYYLNNPRPTWVSGWYNEPQGNCKYIGRDYISSNYYQETCEYEAEKWKYDQEYHCKRQRYRNRNKIIPTCKGRTSRAGTIEYEWAKWTDGYCAIDDVRVYFQGDFVRTKNARDNDVEECTFEDNTHPVKNLCFSNRILKKDCYDGRIYFKGKFPRAKRARDDDIEECTFENNTHHTVDVCFSKASKWVDGVCSDATRTKEDCNHPTFASFKAWCDQKTWNAVWSPICRYDSSINAFDINMSKTGGNYSVTPIYGIPAAAHYDVYDQFIVEEVWRSGGWTKPRDIDYNTDSIDNIGQYGSLRIREVSWGWQYSTNEWGIVKTGNIKEVYKWEVEIVRGGRQYVSPDLAAIYNECKGHPKSISKKWGTFSNFVRKTDDPSNPFFDTIINLPFEIEIINEDSNGDIEDSNGDIIKILDSTDAAQCEIYAKGVYNTKNTLEQRFENDRKRCERKVKLQQEKYPQFTKDANLILYHEHRFGYCESDITSFKSVCPPGLIEIHLDNGAKRCSLTPNRCPDDKWKTNNQKVYEIAETTKSMQMEDLDGDGDIDILIGFSDRPYLYFENKGTVKNAIFSLNTEKFSGVQSSGNNVNAEDACLTCADGWTLTENKCELSFTCPSTKATMVNNLCICKAAEKFYSLSLDGNRADALLPYAKCDQCAERYVSNAEYTWTGKERVFNPESQGTGCICDASDDYYNVDNVACKKCPPGKKANWKHADLNSGKMDVEEATECFETNITVYCSSGKFLGEDGKCEICPAGKYNRNNFTITRGTNDIFVIEDAHKCKDCAAGRQTNSDGSDCDNCPAGTYFITTDEHITCQKCPLGKYSDNFVVDTDCKDCAKDNYTDTTGAVTCKTCPSGYYSLLTGRPDCEPCSENSVAKDDDGPGCVDPPAGQTAVKEFIVTVNDTNITVSDDDIIDNGATYTVSVNNIIVTVSQNNVEKRVLKNQYKNCSHGEYSNVDTEFECTKVPEGKELFFIATSDTQILCPGDWRCAETKFIGCPPKYYCNGVNCTNNAYLESTDKGKDYSKRNDIPDNSDCTRCPQGWASIAAEDSLTIYNSNGWGNNECIECPAGTYSSRRDKLITDPISGEILESVYNGDTKCKACKRGTYSDTTSTIACKDCWPPYVTPDIEIQTIVCADGSGRNSEQCKLEPSSWVAPVLGNQTHCPDGKLRIEQISVTTQPLNVTSQNISADQLNLTDFNTSATIIKTLQRDCEITEGYCFDGSGRNSEQCILGRSYMRIQTIYKGIGATECSLCPAGKGYVLPTYDVSPNGWQDIYGTCETCPEGKILGNTTISGVTTNVCVDPPPPPPPPPPTCLANQVYSNNVQLVDAHTPDSKCTSPVEFINAHRRGDCYTNSQYEGNCLANSQHPCRKIELNMLTKVICDDRPECEWRDTIFQTQDNYKSCFPKNSDPQCVWNNSPSCVYKNPLVFEDNTNCASLNDRDLCKEYEHCQLTDDSLPCKQRLNCSTKTDRESCEDHSHCAWNSCQCAPGKEVNCHWADVIHNNRHEHSIFDTYGNKEKCEQPPGQWETNEHPICADGSGRNKYECGLDSALFQSDQCWDVLYNRADEFCEKKTQTECDAESECKTEGIDCIPAKPKEERMLYTFKSDRNKEQCALEPTEYVRPKWSNFTASHWIEAHCEDGSGRTEEECTAGPSSLTAPYCDLTNVGWSYGREKLSFGDDRTPEQCEIPPGVWNETKWLDAVPAHCVDDVIKNPYSSDTIEQCTGKGYITDADYFHCKDKSTFTEYDYEYTNDGEQYTQKAPSECLQDSRCQITDFKCIPFTWCQQREGQCDGRDQEDASRWIPYKPATVAWEGYCMDGSGRTEQECTRPARTFVYDTHVVVNGQNYSTSRCSDSSKTLSECAFNTSTWDLENNECADGSGRRMYACTAPPSHVFYGYCQGNETTCFQGAGSNYNWWRDETCINWKRTNPQCELDASTWTEGYCADGSLRRESECDKAGMFWNNTLNTFDSDCNQTDSKYVNKCIFWCSDGSGRTEDDCSKDPGIWIDSHCGTSWERLQEHCATNFAQEKNDCLQSFERPIDQNIFLNNPEQICRLKEAGSWSAGTAITQVNSNAQGSVKYVHDGRIYITTTSDEEFVEDKDLIIDELNIETWWCVNKRRGHLGPYKDSRTPAQCSKTTSLMSTERCSDDSGRKRLDCLSPAGIWKEGECEGQGCNAPEVTVAENASCVECPAGTYKFDNTTCKKCPENEYTSRAGSLSCEKCYAGVLNYDIYGMPVGCGICPAGKFGIENKLGCHECGRGKYMNDLKRIVTPKPVEKWHKSCIGQAYLYSQLNDDYLEGFFKFRKGEFWQARNCHFNDYIEYYGRSCDEIEQEFKQKCQNITNNIECGNLRKEHDTCRDRAIGCPLKSDCYGNDQRYSDYEKLIGSCRPNSWWSDSPFQSSDEDIFRDNSGRTMGYDAYNNQKKGHEVQYHDFIDNGCIGTPPWKQENLTNYTINLLWYNSASQKYEDFTTVLDTYYESPCLNCPKGTYKGDTDNFCVTCANGTTVGEGSWSAKQCNTCAIGKYMSLTSWPKKRRHYAYEVDRNWPLPEDNTCLSCSKSYYQDETGSYGCKICPGGTQPNEWDNIQKKNETCTTFINEQFDLNDNQISNNTGKFLRETPGSVPSTRTKCLSGSCFKGNYIDYPCQEDDPSTVFGSTHCSKCPEGKYSTDEHFICETCPKFSNLVVNEKKNGCFCDTEKRTATGGEMYWIWDIHFSHPDDRSTHHLNHNCRSCENTGPTCATNWTSGELIPHCGAVIDHNGECQRCPVNGDHVCVDGITYCKGDAIVNVSDPVNVNGPCQEHKWGNTCAKYCPLGWKQSLPCGKNYTQTCAPDDPNALYYNDICNILDNSSYQLTQSVPWDSSIDTTQKVKDYLDTTCMAPYNILKKRCPAVDDPCHHCLEGDDYYQWMAAGCPSESTPFDTQYADRCKNIKLEKWCGGDNCVWMGHGCVGSDNEHFECFQHKTKDSCPNTCRWGTLCEQGASEGCYRYVEEYCGCPTIALSIESTSTSQLAMGLADNTAEKSQCESTRLYSQCSNDTIGSTNACELSYAGGFSSNNQDWTHNYVCQHKPNANKCGATEGSRDDCHTFEAGQGGCDEQSGCVWNAGFQLCEALSCASRQESYQCDPDPLCQWNFIDEKCQDAAGGSSGGSNGPCNENEWNVNSIHIKTSGGCMGGARYFIVHAKNGLNRQIKYCQSYDPQNPKPYCEIDDLYSTPTPIPTTVAECNPQSAVEHPAYTPTDSGNWGVDTIHTKMSDGCMVGGMIDQRYFIVTAVNGATREIKYCQFGSAYCKDGGQGPTSLEDCKPETELEDNNGNDDWTYGELCVKENEAHSVGGPGGSSGGGSSGGGSSGGGSSGGGGDPCDETTLTINSTHLKNSGGCSPPEPFEPKPRYFIVDGQNFNLGDNRQIRYCQRNGGPYCASDGPKPSIAECNPKMSEFEDIGGDGDFFPSVNKICGAAYGGDACYGPSSASDCQNNYPSGGITCIWDDVSNKCVIEGGGGGDNPPCDNTTLTINSIHTKNSGGCGGQPRYFIVVSGTRRIRYCQRSSGPYCETDGPKPMTWEECNPKSNFEDIEGNIDLSVSTICSKISEASVGGPDGSSGGDPCNGPLDSGACSGHSVNGIQCVWDGNQCVTPGGSSGGGSSGSGGDPCNAHLDYSTCCEQSNCGWDGPDNGGGTCWTDNGDNGRPNTCDGSCGFFETKNDCCGKTGVGYKDCAWDVNSNQCYHSGCCGDPAAGGRSDTCSTQ